MISGKNYYIQRWEKSQFTITVTCEEERACVGGGRVDETSEDGGLKRKVNTWRQNISSFIVE